MVFEEDKQPWKLRSEAEDVLRFRDYADADADWFWELDPNFRFAIVSMRREGRSSVGEFDLLGKTAWEFADADPDRDHEWAAFVDKLQRREPFRSFRISLRHEGGGKVYWRLSGKPVLGDDGRFFGYRGIATDESVDAIRRQHLEALSADYQMALESIAEGVAYFDERDRLSFTNPAFRSLVPLPSRLFQVGTALNDQIRMEGMLTYRWPMSIDGTDGAGNTLSGEVESVSAMFNLYYDIKQAHEWIGNDTATPYVGGGVGVSMLDTDTLQNSAGTSENGTLSYNLSYAAMAGVATKLSVSLVLDVGYRFINRGEFEQGGATEFDDLLAHEVRAGLRLQF